MRVKRGKFFFRKSSRWYIFLNFHVTTFVWSFYINAPLIEEKNFSFGLVFILSRKFFVCLLVCALGVRSFEPLWAFTFFCVIPCSSLFYRRYAMLGYLNGLYFSAGVACRTQAWRFGIFVILIDYGWCLWWRWRSFNDWWCSRVLESQRYWYVC